MIEGHGDDLYRYDGKIKYNFSSNIYSGIDHSSLLNHLRDAGSVIASYPEPEPLTLERKLSERCGCAPENFFVGNGATEIIYMIATCFSGSNSTIVVPTFREYQDACKLHRHNITFVTSLKDIPSSSRLVWICNPNNPTGEVFRYDTLLDMIDRDTSCFFVIDQAYSDYTEMDVLSESDVCARKNVLILKSLTKRFAIPGLRVGYAAGGSGLISRVKEWRMPWSVNALAIKGAEYLLDHEKDYPIDCGLLHNELVRIACELEKEGIEWCFPSETNFGLFRLRNGRKSSDLKRYLVESHGILIRDASNFEGLTEAHFRIASQMPEINNLLIKAIKEWNNL